MQERSGFSDLFANKILADQYKERCILLFTINLEPLKQ